MPTREIRVERSAGYNIFVPLHILPEPLAPVDYVTILSGADVRWHKDLSIELNPAAYNMVQEICALGANVIDIGHLSDGTSRIGLVLTREADTDHTLSLIVAILRSAFDLDDCAAVLQE